MIPAADAAEAIQKVLEQTGRTGLIEELGVRGNIRLTLVAELPPDIVGQIVDLVRQHAIRTPTKKLPALD